MPKNLDELMAIIASSEAKSAKSEKKQADKHKNKVNSETFRQHFLTLYRDRYKLGYVSKVVQDRTHFKKLMQSYDSEMLMEMIDHYIYRYESLQGISLKSFPRPTVGGLLSWSNQVASAIQEKEGVSSDEYSESDGLTF